VSPPRPVSRVLFHPRRRRFGAPLTCGAVQLRVVCTCVVVCGMRRHRYETHHGVAAHSVRVRRRTQLSVHVPQQCWSTVNITASDMIGWSFSSVIPDLTCEDGTPLHAGLYDPDQHHQQCAYMARHAGGEGTSTCVVLCCAVLRAYRDRDHALQTRLPPPECLSIHSVSYRVPSCPCLVCVCVLNERAGTPSG